MVARKMILFPDGPTGGGVHVSVSGACFGAFDV